jgi:hypothetical protein
MRQSAGKKVKNNVAAARSAKPTNLWSAAWPWAARIRNPVLLLLKTASRTQQACDARRATLGFVRHAKYSRGGMRYAMWRLESEGCSLWVGLRPDGVRSSTATLREI